MCPEGEGGGGGESGGGSSAGGGEIDSIRAILEYIRAGRQVAFSVNGDSTGIFGYGYGAYNITPPGSVPPEDPPLPAEQEARPEPRPARAPTEHVLAPYGARPGPVDAFAAFADARIDPFSGLPRGWDTTDPFTGLPSSDPFLRGGGGARSTGPEVALRHRRLLSSPYLLADNDVVACDPTRASCRPEAIDWAKYYREEPLLAEADESFYAIWALKEQKAQIIVPSAKDIETTWAKAAEVARSDAYKLAYTTNLLRDHPIEMRRSAAWAGTVQMAEGGLTIGGSSALFTANPLIGAIGVASGIARTASGFALALSNADTIETIRMEGALDYVFTLTRTPAALIFGTTGLVLSDGDTGVSQRFAAVGGVLQDAYTLRPDPSKLYSGPLPPGAETIVDVPKTARSVEGVVTLRNAVATREVVPVADLGQVGQITSRQAFREHVTSVIGKPEHPLHLLLDPSTGRLRPSTSRGITAQVWFDDPRIIEAGHVRSAKDLGGLPDRLVIMSAFENRLASGMIEHRRVGGIMLDSGHVLSIGNLPIDLKSAESLLYFGLDAEIFIRAPIIRF